MNEAARTTMRARRRPSRVARGLTLIELTIIVAIIGLMAGLSLVSVNALGHSYLRSESVSLAGAIKECYDRSIMEKRVQRIVFDLAEDTWWVEATDDPYALDIDRLAAADDADELADLNEEPDFDEETPEEVRAAIMGSQSATFELDPAFEGKKKLQGDVHFGRVWTGMREEPFEKGLIFLHFFRGGFTEPLQLELFDGDPDGDDKEYLTLLVRPLTGKVRIYPEQLEAPEEDRRPWEEDR